MDILEQVKEAIADPIPTLNMPIEYRIDLENALYDLADIMWEFRESREVKQ